MMYVLYMCMCILCIYMHIIFYVYMYKYSAHMLAASHRIVCRRALIRAKCTTGSYINQARKLGESRGARFCGLMNLRKFVW